MPYLNFSSARPATKLAIILLSVISLGIIIFFIGILMGRLIFWMNLKQVNDVLFGRYDMLTDWQLKYFQAVQTIGFFIVPGIFLHWLFSSEEQHYFDIKGKPRWKDILLLLILFVGGAVFINWLTELNSSISIPERFNYLANRLKSADEIYSQLSLRMLTADNFGVFLVNLLLIAALPAIGEELLFRGVFQKLFIEMMRNSHVAVFITALLFSAVHGQFYGFLPRLMLGVIFGYLMIWGNTIWLPVAAHLINNALVVIAFYSGFDSSSLLVKPFGINIPVVYQVIFSALVIVTTLYFIKKTKPLNG